MFDNKDLNALSNNKLGAGSQSVRSNARPAKAYGLILNSEATPKYSKLFTNSHNPSNDNSFKKLNQIQQPRHHEGKTSVKGKQSPGGLSSIKLR